MAITPDTPDTYTVDTGTVQLIPDGYTKDGWILFLNGVASSHVVIGDPLHLDFEYMRWMAAVITEFVSAHLNPQKLRVTHLGGGACSMARYLAAHYPRSRNTVVEIDGQMAQLVRELFDIPRSPTVKIRVGEAREVTESFVNNSRDIIIRDVFAGKITPEPLRTVEFLTHCKRSLAPGGLYIANCADGSALQGAKSELASMAKVFEHLAVIADPQMLKGRRYGNIVLAASDAPLPTGNAAAALTRSILNGSLPAQYHTGNWVERFYSGAQPLFDGELSHPSQPSSGHNLW
ncbi:spermidine synthase [Corynebacterium caspium]|uniref:spermidine synthase n=1 Tax=Corynebacterium caspium TaxID=234828 RepID=UPI00037E72AC|nr:fused MFS/spermidine synthase [Corynebacterium caspium]WKD59434.1 spermidine synthase [Corynebacterium caspium DSM 44850]